MHDMFCRQTFQFGVGGCCRLGLFSLNKIFFAMQEFLDVKNIKLVEASVLFLSEKYAWKLRKMKYQRNRPVADPGLRGPHSFMRFSKCGFVIWARILSPGRRMGCLDNRCCFEFSHRLTHLRDANLWRSKIWRLYLLHYNPAPPNVNKPPPSPTPPHKSIQPPNYDSHGNCVGHYMKS